MSFEPITLPDPRAARSDGAAFVRKWSRGLRWVMVLIGLSALAVLVLIPVAQKPRETPLRVICKSNLRQIGLACLMYADDNNGFFPPHFAALVPVYVDNARIFSCNRNPSRWRDFNGGRATAASSSYAYVGGLSASAPFEVILAYDRTPHNRAGRYVLFADAHVEWRREKNFQEELALQRAAIEKWRAAGAKPGELSGYLKAETSDGGGR